MNHWYCVLAVKVGSEKVHGGGGMNSTRYLAKVREIGDERVEGDDGLVPSNEPGGDLAAVVRDEENSAAGEVALPHDLPCLDGETRAAPGEPVPVAIIWVDEGDVLRSVACSSLCWARRSLWRGTPNTCASSSANGSGANDSSVL